MATARTQFITRPTKEYSLSVQDNEIKHLETPRIDRNESLRIELVQRSAAIGPKAQRRDRVQILLKMLQAANAPIRKTHLMYGAGINFYQLEKHLAFLVASGMIEETNQEDDAVTYRTTEKGRLFSELFT